jgi:hypothetical protein
MSEKHEWRGVTHRALGEELSLSITQELASVLNACCAASHEMQHKQDHAHD